MTDSHSGIVELGRPELEQLLPHQNDALVLDRIMIDVAGHSAEGFFYAGHGGGHVFRGHFGVFPGHWLMEFANLTCAALALTLWERSGAGLAPNAGVRLLGADDIRYRKEVHPGENLACHAKLLVERGRVAFFNATCCDSTGSIVASFGKITGARV